MNTLFLLAIAISIVSCQGDNDCGENGSSGTQIEFGNGDFLTIPSCWEHVRTQGIDSETGKIIYNKKDISIKYDIGFLASFYVNEDSPNKVVESSVNEEFWYEIFDRPHENDENCCVHFTFPDRGPANFITSNDKKFEEILEVMKTYQSN